MSRLAVHAARGDGEDLKIAQCSGRCRRCVYWCVSLERSDLSFIGTGDGDEQAAKGDETNRQRLNRTASTKFEIILHCPLA